MFDSFKEIVFPALYIHNLCKFIIKVHFPPDFPITMIIFLAIRLLAKFLSYFFTCFHSCTFLSRPFCEHVLGRSVDSFKANRNVNYSWERCEKSWNFSKFSLSLGKSENYFEKCPEDPGIWQIELYCIKNLGKQSWFSEGQTITSAYCSVAGY